MTTELENELVGQASAVDTQPASRRYGTAEKVVDIAMVSIWLAVGSAWTFNPLRTQFTGGTFANYFESQALSFVRGDLAIEKGLLGIEAFIRDGLEYMYFGPLLGLFRIPFAALDIDLQGRLTLPLMLAGAALLYWQAIRLLDQVIDLVHPATTHGPTERLIRLGWRITVGSGTVILGLLSIPWSYHEAHLWSGAVFLTVLNLMIRFPVMPTNRIWIFGVALLALVTNRPTTAYAGLIGVAALIAVVIWRRSASRPAVVQLSAWWALALTTTVTVNWLKFRRPFGIPMEDQLFTSIDANRAEMLDRYDNRYFQTEFIPSNLWAYFRPNGVGISTRFPFFDAPRDLPRVFGDSFYDATYRTASVTATNPLLTILSVVGAIAFIGLYRHASFWRLAPTVAAGILATGAVAGWGYIATRYLTDFLPGMLVLSAIAIAVLLRSLDGREQPIAPGLRRLISVGVVAMISWSTLVWVGIGFNYSYSLGDRLGRMSQLLSIQDTTSRLIGPTVESRTIQLDTLPYERYDPTPPATIAIVGECEALYYSNGETVDTWVAVEYATGDLRRDYIVTIDDDLEVGFGVELLQLTEGPAFDPDAYWFNLWMVIDEFHDDEIEYSLIMYDNFGVLSADDLRTPRGEPMELSITFDHPRRTLFAEQNGRNVLYGHFDMEPLFDSANPGVRYLQSGEYLGITFEEVIRETPWCDRLLGALNE